jgi:hypothetical protein
MAAKHVCEAARLHDEALALLRGYGVEEAARPFAKVLRSDAELLAELAKQYLERTHECAVALDNAIAKQAKL